MHNANYTILSLLFLCICKMDIDPFYSCREPQRAAAANLLTHSETGWKRLRAACCVEKTQKPIVLVVILLPSVDYDWYCSLICIFSTVNGEADFRVEWCWWLSFQKMQTETRWNVPSRLPSVVVHPPPLLGLHYHLRNSTWTKLPLSLSETLSAPVFQRIALENYFSSLNNNLSGTTFLLSDF